MSKHEAKTRQNRVRRMARRQGFEVHKVRRMDPLALDYGTYLLTEGSRELQFENIDDLEQFLATPPHQRPNNNKEMT